MKNYGTRQEIVRAIFEEPIIQKNMKEETYKSNNGLEVNPFEVWADEIRVQLKNNNKRYYVGLMKRVENKYAWAIKEVAFEKGKDGYPSVLSFKFKKSYVLS